MLFTGLKRIDIGKAIEVRKSILLLAVLVSLRCDSILKTNPPDYIRQFSVCKEGDGIMMYFVLSDKSG